MDHGLQESDTDFVLKKALSTLDRHTNNVSVSLEIVSLGLSEIQLRLAAWNNIHGLSRRILLLDSHEKSRRQLSCVIRSELNVQVDVFSTMSEAKRSWNKHKHGVLIVSIGLHADHLEFVRAVGRGPRVLLLADNVDQLNTPNLRKLARNIDAKLYAKPLNNIGEVVLPLIDQVAPLQEDEL